jgi:Planctomycete cytochrome C
VRVLSFLLVPTIVLGLASSLLGQPADTTGIQFFETRIRPVLAERCYACHSEEARTKRKLKGELLLDSRAGVLTGGATGPVIVAGKPSESLLIKALRYK